jgi:hypothetical protein
VAAIDRRSGAALPWDGGADRSAHLIDASEGTMLIGGPFNSAGGVARQNLAAINLESGEATDWSPSVDDEVACLLVNRLGVLAGGKFQHVNGVPRSYLAAIDPWNGSLRAWDPHPDQPVDALLSGNVVVYAGGLFENIGRIERHHLAAIDATGVLALARDGGTIYAGGEFGRIGEMERPYLGAVDATTGSPTSWNPSPNGIVRALVTWNETVIAGGDFRRIGGAVRWNLAELDILHGNALSRDLGPANGSVFDLAVDGTTLYVSGSYNRIQSMSRNAIAAIDLQLGQVLSWDARIDRTAVPRSTIYSVAPNGQQVYVGGSFLEFERWRLFLAGFQDDSGGVSAFIPNDVPGSESESPRRRFSMAVTPNPIVEQGSIIIDCPRACTADVAMFDLLGRRVKTIADALSLIHGQNRIPFSGSNFSPGIYFLTMRGDGVSVSKKVVVSGR